MAEQVHTEYKQHYRRRLKNGSFQNRCKIVVHIGQPKFVDLQLYTKICRSLPASLLSFVGTCMAHNPFHHGTANHVLKTRPENTQAPCTCTYELPGPKDMKWKTAKGLTFSFSS